MNVSNLGDLNALAKKMQDAYGDGVGAMNQASKQVREDINPDHEVVVAVSLSAKIEGHPYIVDAEIVFDIELEPILATANSPMGDLSAALDGLDVDLGDDKDAVMEQLGKPRAVGVVKKIDLKKIELHNEDGKVDADLNKDGTLIATVSDGQIAVNFESVLSFPEMTDVFVAIPTTELMQKNVVVDVEDLESKKSFSWTEKDKDNLKVSGSIQFSKI